MQSLAFRRCVLRACMRAGTRKIMRNPSVLSTMFPCSRYLAITQPLIYSRRRRSKRLAGLMIVAVWVMAGAITSPPLLGCFPRATNRDIKKCSYNMDSSYVIFSSMGSFFLPMLVMLYVYGRISCVIASRHRNLETNEAENVRPRRRIMVRIILLKHMSSVTLDVLINYYNFYIIYIHMIARNFK